MDSATTDSPWDTAVTMLSHPRLLLQGVVEYALAWSFTRGWARLLLRNWLPLLIILSSLGLIGYGLSLSRQTLVKRYDQWVSSELPEVLHQLDDSAEGAAAEKSSEEKVVSRAGELLLRRLLQLQDSNSRITYLVAAQLARQNRLGQARQMMRRIAPVDSGGFRPAHTWLAIDQLQPQKLSTSAQRDLLMHDLEQATQWSGCPVGLYSLYAELLENANKTPEAMAVLEKAGAQETSLLANLKIAELAVKHDQLGRLKRAAEAIKNDVNPRRENRTATTSDYVVLGNVMLFAGELQPAREVVTEGLREAPDNPQLLRLLSESYRLEYRQSVTRVDGQTEVNLALLDAALKADPTNPLVGTEIAQLITAGASAPPELKKALQQQLAAGQSTALTHILLANRALQNNDLAAAEPHLEVALRQAPANPTVMNNLALVLARTKPSQIDRALELSMAACRAAPNSAQFRDTLGEIRAIQGDKLGAIESLEAAIGLDPRQLSSRRRLAALYQELGMTDMAQVQIQEIAKLKSATPPTAP